MDTSKISHVLAGLYQLPLEDRLFIVENIITKERQNDEERLRQLIDQMSPSAK